MSLTLRVLAPDQSVFDGTVQEVILPSTTGLLGILPGHISMVTALDTGVLRALIDGNWSSIVLTGGFAEVEANDVTVLVNSAELGTNIDQSSAEKDLEQAQAKLSQLESSSNSPEKIKAQQQLNTARARLQASSDNT